MQSLQGAAELSAQLCEDHDELNTLRNVLLMVTMALSSWLAVSGEKLSMGKSGKIAMNGYFF